MLWQVLVAVLLGTECNAQLQHVNQVKVFCTNEADFVCSLSNGNEVMWVVVLSNGVSRMLSFNKLTDSVSAQKLTIIQSTTMRASLTFANSSHLVTTLTIAADLNATVRCQSWSIDYQFEDYSKFLPVELTLTFHDEIYGIPQYLATWKPDDWANVSRYRVAVSPATPPCGVSEFLQSASAIINLHNSDAYDISISFGVCPERMKSLFNFGQCEPIESTLISVINYKTDILGNITANVSCNKQNVSTITEINCDSDGHWIPNITEYCNPSTTFADIEETTQEFTNSTSKEYTTIKQIEDTPIPANPASNVIIGSLAASSPLMLCIGFIFGLLCRFKCCKKEQRDMLNVQQFREEELPKLPIYEELKLKDTNSIGFSENVAYGETKIQCL